MNLIIDSNLNVAFPDMKVSIVEIKLINKPEFNQSLIELKKGIENKIRNDCMDPGDLERNIKYNSFYKKFGSKAPMEYQIRSILNDKEIPMINPIITCMFMAELKNIILTAGHDSDKLGGKIEVSCSDGSEEYVKIDGKSQKLKKDDIFATDGKGIISSVLYGPDLRTRVTDETRNCMFMCYYPFEIDDGEIRNHMQDIINYLNISSKNNLKSGNIEISKVSERSQTTL